VTAEDKRSWFIIIYKISAKPSTARVTAWKKVRELGSLPLQQSVYILPKLPKLKVALNRLQEQIQQLGGECKVLEIEAFEAIQEKETIAEFNSLRNQEYKEIAEESAKLVLEIDREAKAGKYNFAESEDTEKRFLKLKEWFEATNGRDFFGADFKGEANKAIKECKSVVDAFNREVFSREQASEKDKTLGISLVVPLKPSQTEIEKQFYTKEELLARFKDFVSNLENNILKIGNEEISIIPESTIMELKYKTRRGKNSIIIEIEY